MAFSEELPELGQVPDNYFTGNSRITSGQLSALLNRLAEGIGYSPGQPLGGAFTRTWSFQTNTTVGYAGGFYEHAPSPSNFSAPVSFGVASASVAAHFFVVTGASVSSEVRISITGNTIDDNGVRIPAATTEIVIPAGTPANSYFETPEKYNGNVLIETISGTPVSCNYGYAKYHDAGNRDFVVTGLETLWESDSTDSTSDIELIHHKSTGWTYNPAGTANPPIVYSRSSDHATDINQYVGQGAWKRTNLDLSVNGSGSEGILFRITSGSTGLGSLSFRQLDLELSIAFS